MAQLKFRTIPKRAPTLIEALTDALERLAILEVRVDRVEIHQQTQQTLVYPDHRGEPDAE